MLKLASWNVNSIKIRLDHVIDWLQTTQTDILALQETKIVDNDFPIAAFEELGYHFVFSGQKSYNGVAIISKHPIQDVLRDLPVLIDPQRRILAASIAGIRLINLYVPNGSTVGSEKYAYKLDWLQKVTQHIEEEIKNHEHVAIVGDFNIAPEDIDVHDPAEWLGSVLVSEAERLAFRQMLELGLVDSFRQFPQEEKKYSWWDYRAASFRRNRGLRIDHVLLSKSLAATCLSSSIDVAPRRLERPSDHAPVFVELER